MQWRKLGASIIGGCGQFGPDSIEKIREHHVDYTRNLSISPSPPALKLNDDDVYGEQPEEEITDEIVEHTNQCRNMQTQLGQFKICFM